jgi:DNA invertase Pin-like site-specific DNA recombinase
MPRKTRNNIAIQDCNATRKLQQTWRIAAYIRLSREDENKVEPQNSSESIINQKKILKEYLEKFFEGQYEVVDFYVDDGLSGTDDTRAEFMRMIADVEQNRVNCVLCKTLSRAFRNYSDQGYYLEYYFPLKKIRFISTGDPKIDTYLNPEAITGLEVPITGLMNDRYAAKTSADVRRTFNTKRRNGEFIGGFAPYGYLKDPNNKNSLVVDENAAEVVKNIFRWFVQDGMSKRGIALKLNELGEPNPTAYKQKNLPNYNTMHTKMNDGFWSYSPVCSILCNEVYTGTMVQGRYKIISYKVHKQVRVPESEWFVVPNTHEAIIDRETFEKARKLHNKDTRTANGEAKLHLFAGFIRCADCNRAMPRHESRGFVYYFCRSYRDKQVCTPHSIREDRLIKTVLRAIQVQISLVEDLAEQVERINHAPVVQLESKRLLHLRETVEKQLTQNGNAADSLYLDWKNGDISREEYLRLKEKLTEQGRKLQENLRYLNEQIEETANGINTTDPYFKTFLEIGTITELNRGILVELVDTIWIHRNGEVRIDFNFTDQYRKITEFIEINTTTNETSVM